MTNKMHSVTFHPDGAQTVSVDCVEVQPALQSFLMPDLPGTQKLAEPAYGYTAADLYAFADAAIKLNRIALPVQPAPKIPDGMCLVPIEPTQAMIDYADKTVPTVFSIGDEYRAMIAAHQAALPKQPAPESKA